MSKKTLENFLPTLPVFKENDFSLISPIWETHCHLDMLKETDVNELILKLNAIGVEKVTTIATSKKNFQKVCDFAGQYESVHFTLGTHPHEAKDFSESDFKFIKDKFNETKKLIAVGEIGLDYYYDFSPRDKQIEALEKQLQLSIDLGLPVVIHNRDSDEDMISVLKNFNGKVRGVIHSFSSGEELAEAALDLGFYLGFNGMATFKTAENVRSAIENCPLERILIETDAPFLTPTPFRGRENNSGFLPIIAQKVIDLKGVDPLVGLQTIFENSKNCFSRS